MKINQIVEGYKILPPIDREKYQERDGLEGPFRLANSKVVYYDPREGSYYDPDTDMYIPYAEYIEMDKHRDTADIDEVVQGWAARAVGSMVFAKAYNKALEILRKEIEKDPDARHSIEYKAAKMLDRIHGGDKIDPKVLANMYRKQFATEDMDLEEAPGAIRKGLGVVAMLAALWGVNNEMAQTAYENSPQLQMLTAYLEVAHAHNDKRMIDQLQNRIENHKARISTGQGEVMGRDGKPVKVVYDKEVGEAKQRLDPKCWKGYKKQGTKMKGGVKVNNCVPK
jgi:hypothetical protein